MESLEKVANYLDSFGPQDPNYDYVCYIREKLADIQAAQTAGVINDDPDESVDEASKLETAEQDKANQNLEGSLMDGAFKDLDVLNELDNPNTKKASSPVKDLLDKLTRRE
jgi:hypothetical protein